MKAVDKHWEFLENQEKQSIAGTSVSTSAREASQAIYTGRKAFAKAGNLFSEG